MNFNVNLNWSASPCRYRSDANESDLTVYRYAVTGGEHSLGPPGLSMPFDRPLYPLPCLPCEGNATSSAACQQYYAGDRDGEEEGNPERFVGVRIPPKKIAYQDATHAVS